MNNEPWSHHLPSSPPLTLSHGKLAKFADGAAVVTVGSTSVLTTAVAPAPTGKDM